VHPPPLNEGEALASRILELGPAKAQFLGPVIIEVSEGTVAWDCVLSFILSAPERGRGASQPHPRAGPSRGTVPCPLSSVR
jgi:hypothetical protein